MGTNCAPLVGDLFLFCYERDFMMSLSDDKQADVIDASRYEQAIINLHKAPISLDCDCFATTGDRHRELLAK